jgi:adenylate cyclase 9
MIDSLMPRKYSQVIMEDFDVFRERVQNVNISRQGDDDLQKAIFRPLHIERMENVSILFADIVGFTHMSSNKTASQLVSLLSDLYGRFDDLCVRMSCEKIATLGDCYYCVSGCPEPREDHAKDCVLMGLAMINAIEEFDEDNHEEVDMRVGVHSGSVNCGIVGTKKFKFDIFSNDVTLANKMESTGKPGKLFQIKYFVVYLFILKGVFF